MNQELAAYQGAVESAKQQIADLRRRAEQAEALARTLQSDLEALRQTVLAYVTSATYEERERLRAELYGLVTKGS